MLSTLRIIAQDFRGIWRVCGPWWALRWGLAVLVHLRECRRTNTLQPADEAMGEGPFRVRLRGAQAVLRGKRVFCHIREIWVRDVYLGGGFLSIKNGNVVVDLGAHGGTFTSLALAHGPDVSVISVEPNAIWNEEFRKGLGHAGWLDRVKLVRCFLGGLTQFQRDSLRNPECRDVPFLSEDEFIRNNDIRRIDFLKCDIEGSEFDLLTSDSKLLAMTRQLAIELHDEAGDRHAFMRMLEQLGFQVRVWRAAPNNCIALARRAPA